VGCQVTVMKVGRLFDGTGDEPIERGLIVVRGDEIEAVGVQGQVDVPAGADIKTMDFGNAMALPGLIDVHTHLVLPGDGTPVEAVMKHNNDGILLLQAAKNARRALLAGITTVADMGSRNMVTFTLREAINMELMVGPRLVLCGRPLTRTGGHCWFFNGEADGPERIRHTVRQFIREGADVIKVMATGGGTAGTDPYRATYSLEELEAAVGEAHRANKKAVAHCSATVGTSRALAAGFDVIFHGHFYEPTGRLRFQPDVARQLAASPVYLNPTLQVNLAWLEMHRAIADALPPDERRALEVRARQMENVSKLVEYGVKIVAGSDAGWGVNPFGDFVAELEAMVTVGMPSTEVLLAATRDAARSLGVDHLAGTLEAGKKADVLVVAGDPTHDVGALRDIQSVVLGGEVVSP